MTSKPEFICEICRNPFIPRTDKGTQKICNNPERNCKTIRQREYERTYGKKQLLSSSPKKQGNTLTRKWKNTSKKLPELPKRICKFPRCSNATANNGRDYFYCEHHRAKVNKKCSGEYPDMVYAEMCFDVDMDTI